MTILVDTKTNMVFDVQNNEEDVRMQPEIKVGGVPYTGMDYDYD